MRFFHLFLLPPKKRSKNPMGRKNPSLLEPSLLETPRKQSELKSQSSLNLFVRKARWTTNGRHGNPWGRTEIPLPFAGSMGRLYIYLHEWWIFMVNVGRYTIDCECCGMCWMYFLGANLTAKDAKSDLRKPQPPPEKNDGNLRGPPL